MALSDTKPWWQGSFGYQIYIRSFADSNDDGFGDFQGIRSKIPYLKDLGIDFVWITPFYPSPMADWGYDVAEYCDIDPTFGTLDDFDSLVEQAHANDIKIVADLVPNHTSDHMNGSKKQKRDRKTNFAITTFGKTQHQMEDPQTTGLHTLVDQLGHLTKLQASTTCISSYPNNQT